MVIGQAPGSQHHDHVITAAFPVCILSRPARCAGRVKEPVLRSRR